jgi:hypothetical protein
MDKGFLFIDGKADARYVYQIQAILSPLGKVGLSRCDDLALPQTKMEELDLASEKHAHYAAEKQPNF